MSIITLDYGRSSQWNNYNLLTRILEHIYNTNNLFYQQSLKALISVLFKLISHICLYYVVVLSLVMLAINSLPRNHSSIYLTPPNGKEVHCLAIHFCATALIIIMNL